MGEIWNTYRYGRLRHNTTRLRRVFCHPSVVSHSLTHAVLSFLLTPQKREKYPIPSVSVLSPNPNPFFSLSIYSSLSLLLLFPLLLPLLLFIAVVVQRRLNPLPFVCCLYRIGRRRLHREVLCSRVIKRCWAWGPVVEEAAGSSLLDSTPPLRPLLPLLLAPFPLIFLSCVPTLELPLPSLSKYQSLFPGSAFLPL